MQIQKISNNTASYKTQISAKTINKYSEAELQIIKDRNEHSQNANNPNISFKGRMSTETKMLTGAIATGVLGYACLYIVPPLTALCWIFTCLFWEGVRECDAKAFHNNTYR